jgi:hypothetical protein
VGCIRRDLLVAEGENMQLKGRNSEQPSNQFHVMYIRFLGLKLSCILCDFNPLKQELNPSAQRCLTRIFTGDFASWTLHFVNISVKNQQTQQLLIQFINYLWYLLQFSALHCHPQGAFLVPSDRCSIEEQSIEYYGWA